MKSLFFFLLFTASLNAQQLVPYQVQNAKAWNLTAAWGYKDKNFNIVIQPINEAPNLFKNGYCVLVKNGKMGLMDAKGSIIIQPVYERCSDAVGDWVEVKDATEKKVEEKEKTKEERIATFYFDFKKEKIKPNYFINIRTQKKFEPYNSNYPTVSTEISILPNVFVTRFYDTANKKTYYGLKNSAGEIKLNPIYKNIDRGSHEDDILRVETTDGLYGFVDDKANWITQPKYNYLWNFEEGIAYVKLNNKVGFINKLGKEILPIQFDKAQPFEKGYAAVTLGSEVSVIDKSGKTFFKDKSIKYISNVNEDGFVMAYKNDSFYIVDKNGAKLSVGANNIVTFDHENFLLHIGTNVFALFNKTLTHLALDNVVRVRALKMGIYIIDCKGEKDEKENTTIFDSYGNSIATKDSAFTYLEIDDLQLLCMGWDKITPVENWENIVDHYVYSYVTSTGKKYSDITP